MFLKKVRYNIDQFYKNLKWFLSLQRNILFKSKVLFFIILLPIFIFFSLSSVVPLSLSLFVLLSINVNVLSYFQFGAFYLDFQDTVLEKNILLKSGSKISKDINFITFSIIISFVVNLLIIGLISFLQFIFLQINIDPIYIGSNPVNFNYLWWNALIVYIVIGSMLSITFSYFIIFLTNKNKLLFYSIGIMYLFIVIFFSGSFISPYVIVFDESLNQYIKKPNLRSDTSFMHTVQTIIPQYQLNAMSSYIFRIPNANVDNLNPLFLKENLNNYLYASSFIVVWFVLGFFMQVSY